MPLYEYQCPHCGRFELIQRFSDAPLSACPTCGREVQKLLSAPAIQFKGSGWYVTDYARKSTGGEAAAKGDGDKTAERAKSGEGASKGDSSTSTTTASKDGSASSSKNGAPSSNSSSSTAK